MSLNDTLAPPGKSNESYKALSCWTAFCETMMNSRNLLTCLITCVPLISSLAKADGNTHQLSPVQMAIVARQIAQLRYPQERALASSWSDAKKAAEFLCRPVAIKTLKQRWKDADRIFLGDNSPQSLHLIGERQLTGYGQVRMGTGWRTFDFACTLDPKSGKAVGFEPRFPSSGR